MRRCRRSRKFFRLGQNVNLEHGNRHGTSFMAGYRQYLANPAWQTSCGSALNFPTGNGARRVPRALRASGGLVTSPAEEHADGYPSWWRVGQAF